ncbi:MAG: hypothetical protein ACJ77V_05055 [Chloroflexota bacterium]
MVPISRVLAVIVLAIVLGACGPGSSSPTANATLSAPASPAAASDSPSSVPGSGSNVGQTDTDWGRIWDRLPAGFPTIPGATPDEEAAGGPASAVLVVEGTDAETVATSLQTSLQAAGYTAVGSLEPLEDGSVVLDMTGRPKGCILQATATPTGGVTTIRILYGAACPNG